MLAKLFENENPDRNSVYESIYLGEDKDRAGLYAIDVDNGRRN